jgi:hypothetical protein
MLARASMPLEHRDWISAIALLLAWVASAALVVPTGLFLALALLTVDRIWYFPGDPPFFDLALLVSGPSAVVTSLLWLATKRVVGYRPRLRWLRTAGTVVWCTTLVVVMTCMAGIAFRFTPGWRELRRTIRSYGDVVAHAAGGTDRTLTEDEFERFRRQYMPKAVPVMLEGYGTVYVRMSHGVYPYVGVDFTAGSHAFFDPTTMMCTYSD